MSRCAAMMLALTMALIVAADVGSATVVETVTFRSAAVGPTPLMQRLARMRGQMIRDEPPIELRGELFRPQGEGPFAALVALHGCAGRMALEIERAAAARYAEWGYAVLVVDSFGTRGIEQSCTVEKGVAPDRVLDAYGALIYLSRLPYIDGGRIAVIGSAQGGGAALSAVARGGIETTFERRFKAAIAFYPWCGAAGGNVSVPALVLIGEQDEWTPAWSCRNMMAEREAGAAPLELVIYPGSHHAFNATPLRDGPRTLLGYRLEYDEAADRAAVAAIRAFLSSVLGR